MIDGATIKRLREQRRLSQRELASRLGVTNPTISRWEKGESPCSDDWKPKLARALEVPIEALEVVNGEYDAPQPLITARLPLYGDVPAGARDTWPMPAESVEVLADLAKPTRFVLRVNGDSMEPELHPGDLIVVDPVSPSLESQLHFTLEEARIKGPVFVLRYNGQPMLKRIAFAPIRSLKDKKGKVPISLILVCRNPSHQPIEIRMGDTIEIVGRVVAVAWRPL